MENRKRCQSCGMPIGEFTDKDGTVKNSCGLNADGSLNDEYCFYCFENGAFTKPDMTLPEMIANSVHHAERKMGMSLEQAEVMANAVIPGLKRWHDKHKEKEAESVS